MADSGESQQPALVCNFFRKPFRNDSKAESSLLHNQKKAPKPDNKLYFSTGPSKSFVSTESNVESNRSIFQFDSSKEIQVQHDNKATATLETETQFSKDAWAIQEALKNENPSSDKEKLYKGIHGYTDHKAGFQREQTISSEKAGGAHGPLRASAHIRVSARFDYRPNICKDYKETGYCGYGDACKFMHDGGDYKPGWQLEKENLALREDEDGVEQSNEEEEEEDDDYDSLPFACFICRQPLVDPHHAKNKKCFVCSQSTLGIFNTAHEIPKKMAAEGK
ncbi:hypothetical protein P3X46_015763 [Hevea brasiliensis]|uniref:C3H1-type domain-containing protein n=1 Tax=Hevea brasiliensis TaxID=3981 RepID=A0ABQ9LWZ4_HEVBR|nr:hypothetical protein P3X46_015763 [Hevea brasiliensis]